MWLVMLAFLTTGQECQQATSRGREAYERRAYGEAVTLFTEAIAACGATDDLLLAQAQSHLLSRQIPQTLETLAPLLLRNPQHVQALKVRAKALYLGGRAREAEGALHAAARLAPADDEIPYDLGRMFYQQGRHQEALTAFRRSLVSNPYAYKAWDNLGLTAEALGDVEEALRHYLKAIQLVHADHPGYGAVYANVADLLLKRGEYQRAFDFAAEAAQRSPEDARNFFLSGKALVRLQRDETSLRWLERATSLDADYPDPHYLLAQVYRRLGRHHEAARSLETFRRIAEQAPKERR